MRARVLTPVFTEYIPAEPKPGNLYISMQFETAVHLCACGCKSKVVTPLGPHDWVLTFDGTVSLRPSVGNGQQQCRSHYYIRNDRVDWLPRISGPQPGPPAPATAPRTPRRPRHRCLGGDAPGTASVHRKGAAHEPDAGHVGHRPRRWLRLPRASITGLVQVRQHLRVLQRAGTLVRADDAPAPVATGRAPGPGSSLPPSRCLIGLVRYTRRPSPTRHSAATAVHLNVRFCRFERGTLFEHARDTPSTPVDGCCVGGSDLCQLAHRTPISTRCQIVLDRSPRDLPVHKAKQARCR